jgi:isoquinoline 1-oxidoreductase
MAIDSRVTSTSPVERALFADLTRRTFFKGAAAAAGLAVVFRNPTVAQDASPVASTTPSASFLADRYAPPAGFAFLPPTDQVDAYLSIDENGVVTFKTSLIDFGQGIKTGFMQLIAEELNTTLDKIDSIMGQTDVVPFNIGTFGSLSTQLAGPTLRAAAANMREWLLDLGAESLGVDRSEVSAKAGSVVVTADETKSISYGELAGGQASARTIDLTVALKDPATYEFVGKPIHRVEAVAKVTGTMQYGIDAKLDNMVYAKVIRQPNLGSTLVSIDFSAAEAVPGFVASFVDGNFAAVMAERVEQVNAAAAAVVAEWTVVETGNTFENIHDLLRATADDGTPLGVEQVEEGATPVPVVLNEIVTPLTVTIKDQYVNHAPIEPFNALANVTAEKVEIWTSTQSPFEVQAGVATALGRDASEVVVYPLAAGGAFGSKIMSNADMVAAVLSNAIGRPVKIWFTREEQFQFTQFRPAMTVDVITGLDADGKIASWQYDAFTAAYYPETTDMPSASASDWGAVVTEIYDVPGVTTTLFGGHSPLPPYFWRVNGAATNAFARETAITQLAELAGKDAVEFRMDMLGNNPTMAGVLQDLVAQAGYEPTVGPSGKGVGVALAFDANTSIGQIAKISVDEAGVIYVDRVDCVIDCGLAVNPQGITDQVEGSINLSLSPTLTEAIKFENGKVITNTFGQANPIRMPQAAKEVVVGVRQNLSAPMGGVGEPAVAPVMAVIAAAFYDLTGVWLLEVPFTPERVLAALADAGVTLPIGG